MTDKPDKVLEIAAQIDAKLAELTQLIDEVLSFEDVRGTAVQYAFCDILDEPGCVVNYVKSIRQIEDAYLAIEGQLPSFPDRSKAFLSKKEPFGESH
jgi:hypothetical protein